VLVTRAETERPECLQGGVVRLVGNGQQTLLLQSREALAAPTPAACAFAADAPFGAGRTAEQVLDLLRARLRQSGPAA
jgi:UDP-N-acetylglucosamine 2-epimerase